MSLPPEERRKPIGSANKGLVDDAVMILADALRELEMINDSREMAVRMQANFRAQKHLFMAIAKLKEIKA